MSHSLVEKFSREVSLTFNSGEFISIVGKNGAGKSTLLRAIAGLFSYTGSILIDDVQSRTLTRKERARKISFLPQKINIIYPIPVRDFILMGRYPYMRPLGGYAREDFQHVDRIIERLCLEEFTKRPLDELSGGEQQRVLLASALVQGAQFVFLDEPMAFLDPVQQEVMYESLKDVHAKERIGIVIASHHLTQSLKYSSRVIALEMGSVIFDGSPSDFQSPEVLIKTFGRIVNV